MALNFPNQSRSYDATLRAVRFWGHDGAMEASFYVNEDALKRIQPGLRSDEAGLLGAFDSHRDLIHMAAAKAYRRGRQRALEVIPPGFLWGPPGNTKPADDPPQTCAYERLTPTPPHPAPDTSA